ncbi:methionine adenosyltransferase [Mycoplasma sp. CSL7475-4]|uniref:methionine adenosyltransferase n=1 Tax=Mycoplasma sp. CSL7475-4 TaxID=2973942 RepID=UPI00216AFF5D|nr:methionine adenosyltransferase [Mycoplasma sp. CSL7475-4]MCS4536759.1 methionine adenosyltransferase [Mycoplasma sp. CSL7475-4]
MTLNTYKYDYFTSESVWKGHPDKICDTISDSILDEIIRIDRGARVAVETFATNHLIIIGGEITTYAKIDYREVAWTVLEKLGYTRDDFTILVNINTQSPDIAMGVAKHLNDTIKAGDQGIVFGYAVKESHNLLPLSSEFSHHLLKELEKFKENSVLANWLKYDAKSQTTVETSKETGEQRIKQVVISVQTIKNADLDTLKGVLHKYVIEPTLKFFNVEPTDDFEFLLNPTGAFTIGGPFADTGLTGRKIIVDSYGGHARHGGGCWSGKDLTKVDRSAAYYARYVAKNIVAAGLADKFEIQLNYVIGVEDITAYHIETFGTQNVPHSAIHSVIKRFFNFSVDNIVKWLRGQNVNYADFSVYGHFQEHAPWEKTDKAEKIAEFIALHY